ncbi:MAG: hypothetical protein FWD96_04990, partial [Defluviitaleaceae bacterium]|nr:hypothetical protein [Defluviitaleaceae bacterium]
FEVYEAIRQTFDSKEPVACAPEGFEAAVMQRIEALPSRSNSAVSAAHVLVGAVAVLLGTAGTIYFEDISALLALGMGFDTFRSVALSLGAAFGDIMMVAFEMLAQAQLVLLLIFVILMMLQFFVYKFDKA